MTACRVLGSAIALLAVSSLAATPAPLECPPGTRLEAGQKMGDGGTRDFCVDVVSGLKEGPERELRANGNLAGEGTNHAGKRDGVARVYDEGGNFVGQALFEQGTMKSMRMTVEGMRILVDKVNAKFATADAPNRLSVIDENTLAFETVVKRESQFSPEEKARFRDILRNDPRMCRFFPGMGVNEVRMNAKTSSGLELDSFTITAAECTASQPAN